MSEVRAENETAEHFFFAAALTAAGLFIASSLVLSTSAWTEWYAKVTEGQSIPHLADVSFRALVGGTGPDRPLVLLRRWPALVCGGGLIVAAVAIAGRGVSSARAALLGLPLVPTLLNPTSYYAHAVFLMTLAVAGRPGEGAPVSSRDATVWVALLGMCVGQYFAQLIPDQALHFYLDTAMLMVALGWVLFVLARERAEAFGWVDREGGNTT